MPLYYCEWCKEYFEEPFYVREDYGLPGGYYQEFPECPICHGNDWHEVAEEDESEESEDEE